MKGINLSQIKPMLMKADSAFIKCSKHPQDHVENYCPTTKELLCSKCEGSHSGHEHVIGVRWSDIQEHFDRGVKGII
jgi:hypothetical protein